MSGAVVGPHHVGFTVSSIETSLRFWNRFGFELTARFHFAGPDVAEGTGVPAADYELALLERAGEPFILELIEYAGGGTAAPRNDDVGAAHVALQVEDLDSLYEDLSGDGVEFISAPHRQEESGVVWVYAKDPDGITVELLELLDSKEAR